MCNTDDCELVHCGYCDSHTIGNTLIAGLCQDCFNKEEDECNKYMEEKYALEYGLMIHT